MDSQSLRKAAEDGESDEVKALLGSHASFSDLELANALSSAARAGHSEVLGLILSHGIPINEQAFLGACTAEEPAVFEQFIDHGWDINSTEFGHTALRYAHPVFLKEIADMVAALSLAAMPAQNSYSRKVPTPI